MNAGLIAGIPRAELDLHATLCSGQVFRWHRDSDGWWCGLIDGKYAVQFRQDVAADAICWRSMNGGTADTVRAFLRLDDVRLVHEAKAWCRQDPDFAACWQDHPGIRVLRQDPDECFFSFLCASVAPISRISGMLRSVASALSTDNGDQPWFQPFPSAAAIAAAGEDRLRAMGLGFRAVRVAEAARVIADLPPCHLTTLRSTTLINARSELMQFFGVGEKIADCICLFGLGFDSAVPVDTHIWRHAVTRYLPELAGRSLTPAHYSAATKAYRDRFGDLAGWAQQTLFYRAAVARRRGAPIPGHLS